MAHTPESTVSPPCAEVNSESSMRFALQFASLILHTVLSGGHSDTAPPDPIPNSVVKRISGDGSVGFPHVRVAHRQAPIKKKPAQPSGLFCVWSIIFRH